MDSQEQHAVPIWLTTIVVLVLLASVISTYLTIYEPEMFLGWFGLVN